MAGSLAALDHLALGVTDQAVRIQGQHLARKVAAGSAQFAQVDLELLRLGHGMGFQQVVQGAIGGQPGQAVEHLKAAMAQRAVGAQRRPAQGGLVDQVQRQAGGQRRRGR
jgi:hypothetical protein